MKTSAALEAPVRAIGQRRLLVFSGALVLATLGPGIHDHRASSIPCAS